MPAERDADEAGRRARPARRAAPGPGRACVMPAPPPVAGIATFSSPRGPAGGRRPARPLPAGPAPAGRGRRGTHEVDGRGPERILAPAVVQRGVQRAGDDPGRGRMAVTGRRGEGPGQVGPVQSSGSGPPPRSARRRRRAGRCPAGPGCSGCEVGKDRAVLEVGEHQRAVPFGQGDAAIPVPLVAAGAGRAGTAAGAPVRGTPAWSGPLPRPARAPGATGLFGHRGWAAARAAAAPAGSRRGRRRPARTAPSG